MLVEQGAARSGSAAGRHEIPRRPPLITADNPQHSTASRAPPPFISLVANFIIILTAVYIIIALELITSVDFSYRIAFTKKYCFTLFVCLQIIKHTVVKVTQNKLIIFYNQRTLILPNC